jgi:CRISPR-associated endonuclease/helicase Cas3
MIAAMKDYWAHSARQDQVADLREGWQRLSDHLQGVSELAGKLAKAARPQDDKLAADAELCGLLHDYGKYTDCFQRMMETGRGKCQHAIHGAMLSYLGAEGLAAGGAGNGKKNSALLSVAWAIAGHHAGLPDHSELVDGRLKESRYLKEGRDILDRAQADLPRFRQAIEDMSKGTSRPAVRGSRDLYTRMLFSCLVDADRLDTAGRRNEQLPLKAGPKLDALLGHLRSLADKSPDGVVKQMRKRVLDDCLAAADRQEKLFSLSTGGGKTLASMAFALRRAALDPDRFRRVVVVIPYLSIIEQNADVYAKVFGADAVLEHHSGSLMRLKKSDRDPDKFVPGDEDKEDEADFQTSGYRPETENWDSPLIVTTSVRFFESLFSNRPKDLRRVHNIARSIVILDEVQTLPRNLIGPLLGLMKELAEDWGVDFVFSTATQPAFESKDGRSNLLWSPGTLREIVCDADPLSEDPNRKGSLRKALKRAEVTWEIGEPKSWSQVAEFALAERQSLSIVNLRDHARELFATMCAAALEKSLDENSVFHLSTRMCAAHRLRVIEMIRKRVEDKLPCHVVSTQLIEAGVDLDFPLVLRALAPLDSIVQAAGRADREGKLTAELGRPGGRVVVFRSPDDKTPPNDYAEATKKTNSIANQALLDGVSVQVDDANAMKDYYRSYYADGQEPKLLDAKDMAVMRDRGKFKMLADEFEMISDRTKDVYVAHDGESRKLIEELEKEFEEKRHFTPEIRKTLQRLRRSIVGLGPWEFDKAREKGVVRPEVVADSGIWIATETAYTERLGLAVELRPEDLVL